MKFTFAGLSGSQSGFGVKRGETGEVPFLAWWWKIEVVSGVVRTPKLPSIYPTHNVTVKGGKLYPIPHFAQSIPPFPLGSVYGSRGE